MSAAAPKPLDLRAAGEAIRAADVARRQQLRQRALRDQYGRSEAAPAAAVARVQRRSPRWHWTRPRLVLHPVTMGLLAGLAAVFIIALVVPQLGGKSATRPPVVPAVQAVAATTPTPATKPAPAVAARPTDRVIITALGVNAPIVQLGLVDGSLDTPKTLWQVGHYRAGAAPGAAGTAILVGHSGAPGQVGVFEHLDRLKVGDKLVYRYADGREFTYRVTTSAAYPVSPATAEVLFKNTVGPSLNLVSCYGHWDAASKEYDQRWIVTSELVSP